MKYINLKFKNWPSIAVDHTIEISEDIKFSNYKYIWFKTPKFVKMLYTIYKEDFYQGARLKSDPNAPNNHWIIKETGLYNQYDGRKINWTTFREQICPNLLYTFEFNEYGELVIYPINVTKNTEIFKFNKTDILEL